ncbi:MAG: 2-oxoacid:acceptor oxidoreductase subunit alpha [Thermoplasmatota archaeon]
MSRHGVAWRIAGTAGEGLEAGGETFARALAAAGWRPSTQRDFPSRIRGGDTSFTVRLTPEGRLVPPSHVDVALAFNDTVLPGLDASMAADGLLVVDEGVVKPFVAASGCRVAALPFTQLAEEAGSKRAKNMVALGASCVLLGVPVDAVLDAVAVQFARKGDEVVALNQAAVRAGAAAAEALDVRFEAPVPVHGPALFLSGNQAACLGALAAGCRVAAAYPITPASDVLEYLTPRLAELGGVALQMEDEMAALNLCLGAGFAGARALTATSGPGLALMSETVGLAGSTETPVVVLDCQRPGPSTGMPTKHGQEDLLHLVHGGTGEFVRIVVAPTCVEDAFAATSEAFRLAWRFQAPAFVALDQQMCLFKQTVAPFDVAAEAARHDVRGPAPGAEGSSQWEGTYTRYAGDGSESHPVRASLPGEPGLHYANSTEHAASGFTNEVPGVRTAMVERRLRRMEAIVAEAADPILVEDHGPGGDGPADVILLSWGSTVEACREAAARMAADGRSVRVVAVRLIAPLPEAALREALHGDAPIVAAEANATGQFATLLKAALPVHDRLRPARRFDGTPLTSDDVIAAAEVAP